MRANADLFIQTCFNYPTLSEMYKYATHDVLGQRARKRKPAALSPDPATVKARVRDDELQAATRLRVDAVPNTAERCQQVAGG